MEEAKINTITPINEMTSSYNGLNKQNIQPINIEDINKDNSQKDNDFASSLPEWDLIPPYQVVKRVNR